MKFIITTKITVLQKKKKKKASTPQQDGIPTNENDK